MTTRHVAAIAATLAVLAFSGCKDGGAGGRGAASGGAAVAAAAAPPEALMEPERLATLALVQELELTEPEAAKVRALVREAQESLLRELEDPTKVDPETIEDLLETRQRELDARVVQVLPESKREAFLALTGGAE